MDFLGAIQSRFVAITTQQRSCPRCDDGIMEQDYVRSPTDQGHWRGVEADVCTECGYAERADAPPQ